MIGNRNLLYCNFLIHLINDELATVDISCVNDKAAIEPYLVQYGYNITNMTNNGQNVCEISRQNMKILESVGHIVLRTVR